MAEPVQIQGSPYQGKIRNPLGVVGLSIITFGIYHLVWYYKVNKEMAEIGKAHGTEEAGTSPGTSLLALIPGAFIIVPPFVSYYKACKRLNAAERISGTAEGMEAPLLFLLILVIGPVGQYLFQRNLNTALQAQSGAGAGAIAAGSAVPQPAAAPAVPSEAAAPAGAPEAPSSGPQSPAV